MFAGPPQDPQTSGHPSRTAVHPSPHAPRFLLVGAVPGHPIQQTPHSPSSDPLRASTRAASGPARHRLFPFWVIGDAPDKHEQGRTSNPQEDSYTLNSPPPSSLLHSLGRWPWLLLHQRGQASMGMCPPRPFSSSDSSLVGNATRSAPRRDPHLCSGHHSLHMPSKEHHHTITLQPNLQTLPCHWHFLSALNFLISFLC